MLTCFIWHHLPVGVDSADKSGSDKGGRSRKVSPQEPEEEETPAGTANGDLWVVYFSGAFRDSFSAVSTPIFLSWSSIFSLALHFCPNTISKFRQVSKFVHHFRDRCLFFCKLFRVNISSNFMNWISSEFLGFWEYRCQDHHNLKNSENLHSAENISNLEHLFERVDH